MSYKFKIDDVVRILKWHVYEGCVGKVMSYIHPNPPIVGQRFYAIFLRRPTGETTVAVPEDLLILASTAEPFPVLTQCEHTYTLYTGFTDTFEYCTMCNERK